jgi:hypothetical protein
MSTTDSFPADFLLVFGIGGAICAIVWLLARHHVGQSLKLRAFFCLLIGLTVAPTCIQILSSWVICPAVLVLGALAFDGGKNSYLALLYGLLPILVAAGLVFGLWSLLVQHRNAHGKQIS